VIPAVRGHPRPVYDVDPVALLTREVLRERTPALVAETCAWTVGLSDAPHHVRRHGRVVPTGLSLGMRAAAAQQLSVDEDLRLELGEPVAGSFADALGALTADGSLQADRFDAQVLAPFVLETCVEAARRAREASPQAWAELLEDLGEDGDDLAAVVRAAEWDAPLRTDAEQLVLAAVGHAPLVELEAEGLPLSLVRAAEAETRRAAGAAIEPLPVLQDEELAGARFLADVALASSGLEQPVPPDGAGRLLEALLGEGLEPEEVLAVLPHLPVLADTADAVDRRLRGSS
jgi:hypothetical protein